MKSFTDNAGRTWKVTINVETIRRVRALLNLNLLDAVEGVLLERLVHDPVLLCDVLFAIVKPEAESRAVADADFGAALAGDSIDQATRALLEELVDFFPRERRRVLSKALEKMKDLERQALKLAEEKLESVNLEAVLQGLPGANVTG
jgi:hypothetical protein